MTSVKPTGRENALLVGLFCVVLTIHFYCTTINFRIGFLVGHEFRQTQTAISSYFIAKEHDYSLAYPTPLLGKPWSIPMEFPLYQWSVAALSQATGWGLPASGRGVNTACFYLTLPALFLLLGHWNIPRARRLLVLAVILTSPLYIFYTRGFLIEGMALCFSAWFLTALVLGVARRRWSWLAVAVVCGIGASLVKVTTFLLWCLPAGLFCAVQLWREWKSPERRFGSMLAWATIATAPAFLAALWWVRYADAIKRLNFDGGNLLVSSHLTTHNFGRWSMRFEPSTWNQLLHQWHTAVMPLWLIAVLVAGIWFMRSLRPAVAWGIAVFIAAQVIFPLLYSIHDYYFYAAGVFWLGAAGCILVGLLDGPLPRPVFWLLLLTVLAGNLNAYRTGYYQLQKVASFGGSGLTDTLRECTPPGTVLIIAGADWSAMIPYYSQRKALMLRAGLESDWSSMERSYDNLRGEEVAALILVEDQRSNHELAARTTARFNLDHNVTFAHAMADVYLNKDYRQSTLIRLAGSHGYNQIEPRAKPDETTDHQQTGPERRPVAPSVAASAFANVTPSPTFYRFTYGIIPMEMDGAAVVGAHPDSELWVPPPRGASTIIWEFGMLPGSYEREGDKTDGVELIVWAEDAGGHRRQIFRRVLDPLNVVTDRGKQHAEFSYDYRAGETLVFVSGPKGGASYDWAYWARIQVR